MDYKKFYKIKKRQPVWKGVSRFLKLFFKKPKIVSLSGEIPNKAIYVANHSAMFGPVMYNLYLPADVALWGAHPMLEGYKSRYRYLRDVYFIQKRHKSKFSASILAFLEAFFSPYFYKGLREIPSYADARFISTLRTSCEVLDMDIGIMLFPENSSEGYHEILKSFLEGFVMLADYYQRKHGGEDVPIYPVYYHAKKKVMVVGNPSKLTDYTSKGMSKAEIADDFCNQVNNLFLEHIKDKY